ncbi:hypothetical protein G9A89_022457 [Geosiphon pyriformis]|nr:hypothetical protein G9A89_022457 [Geosiphon pyriformis]
MGGGEDYLTQTEEAKTEPEAKVQRKTPESAPVVGATDTGAENGKVIIPSEEEVTVTKDPREETVEKEEQISSPTVNKNLEENKERLNENLEENKEPKRLVTESNSPSTQLQLSVNKSEAAVNVEKTISDSDNGNNLQPMDIDPSPFSDRTVDERTSFEKNFAFEQSIREETKKMPLVCVEESIGKLYEEYQHGSDVYKQKIAKLSQRHGRIRRCRGDGNCFYRAFAFAWFERLLQSRQPLLLNNALRALADTKVILEKAGYQALVFEDIYDVVREQLQVIQRGTRDHDTLLSIFQTDDISNHIVWYLRLVTAAYLKLHRDEYEPFLEMDIGMDQYCSHFVEVMDQEADHIHVIVLTRAIKVPVEIAYMSGSNAMDEVNFHEFYPEETGQGVIPLKPLVLLYRPGHYDILYRNHER